MAKIVLRNIEIPLGPFLVLKGVFEKELVSQLADGGCTQIWCRQNFLGGLENLVSRNWKRLRQSSRIPVPVFKTAQEKY